MLQTASAEILSGMDLTTIVLAIGSLGTAAYGVVDATKAFGGGVSNRGFGDIKAVIAKLIPDSSNVSELGLKSVLVTLRANWLNGLAMADQKSIAKALIKLNLNTESAKKMSGATGVDGPLLESVATKLGTGATLSQQETDVYGRFDLILSAMLDQGYQRGDQRYRNSAKLLAIPVAVVLALIGVQALHPGDVGSYGWKAVIFGLLATPLAPVAKDLSSAIQAGAKVSQLLKK